MPLREITASEIERVAQIFAAELDAERQIVLSHRESADIRACAGSGKTTLLVAKLAILLGNWPHRHRGVCVLSHTNVAHEEIRRRFPFFPALRALESYPHYLGTIQSFLNMALGTPGAVAKFGVRPGIIDDGVFADRALRGLRNSNSYAGARVWLGKRENGDKIVAGLHLRCDPEGVLTLHSSVPGLPQSTSDTTKTLKRLKMESIRAGVFRYDDMDALGLYYAVSNPSVIAAVAMRYPVVFLDETQDTVARQGSLLERLFEGRSVVQRFGDDRQAIYHESDEGELGGQFPRAGHLSMTTSRRFSSSIARLVEHVCVGDIEPLSGRSTTSNHAHTVFLFARDRIANVVPAFARLVAHELGTGLPATRVKAVGFRRHGAPDPEKLPMVVSDYWPSNSPMFHTSSTRFDTLDDYLAATRRSASGGSVSGCRARLLNAACRILELQGVNDGGRAYAPRRLLTGLGWRVGHAHPELLVLFGRLIMDLASGRDLDNVAVGESIRRALVSLHDGPWHPAVHAFCDAPRAGISQTEDQIDSVQEDVFRLKLPAGVVEVGFSTIHGVKGETMDATLVVSTYFYAHDLPQLIETGPLRGKRLSDKKSRQVRLRENVKRVYVAMTRATSLICLAVRDDQISEEHRLEMEELGWRFQHV